MKNYDLPQTKTLEQGEERCMPKRTAKRLAKLLAKTSR